jgi:hypothetical protein
VKYRARHLTRILPDQLRRASEPVNVLDLAAVDQVEFPLGIEIE